MAARAAPVSSVLEASDEKPHVVESVENTKPPRWSAARRFFLPGLVGLVSVAGPVTWYVLRPHAAVNSHTAQSAPPITTPPAPPEVPSPSVLPVPAPPVPASPKPEVPSPKPRRSGNQDSARLLEDARILRSKGDVATAARIAERAVKADGNNIEARLLLADLYTRNSMHRQALTQYEEVLKRSPNEKAALQGRELTRARMR